MIFSFCTKIPVKIFFILTIVGCTRIFSAGTMRDITSMKLVEEMKIGWNLGNTLDATGGSGLNTETSWSNPKTTKSMIDALKAKGFKTVRIPVTWAGHFGNAPDYTIDNAWMNRVQEVVNYVIDNGMYAILNSHHDEWVVLKSGSQNEVTDKITKIWKQIAGRFKDYSDYLIFETLNEPRLYGEQTEWTGGTADARTVLNNYNIAIVNAIRQTGGNNAKRHIMIPTHAATAIEAAQDDLKFPENDDRIIVSQHTYWPYQFTMENPGVNTWGSQKDKDDCVAELERIWKKFCEKGIPVVIGEWGSINKNNTSDRTVHAEFYASEVRKRGMLPVWWDNNFSGPGDQAFGLLNRSDNSWYFPEIAEALIRGSDTPVEKTSIRQPVAPAVSVGPPVNSLPSPGMTFYNLAGKIVLRLSGTGHFTGNDVQDMLLKANGPGTYIVELKTGSGMVHRHLSVTR